MVKSNENEIESISDFLIAKLKKLNEDLIKENLDLKQSLKNVSGVTFK